MHGLGRLPVPLELVPGTCEAGGREERDVVVARHREHGCAETVEERCGTLVLVAVPTVRDVPRCDDQLRLRPLDEGTKRRLDFDALVRAGVEVGDVDQSGRHSRSRLYTDFVADEATELFDDLYLGLRAGGAMRKQRRGEPLTMEEEAALNRWQRLSSWRKAIAVGAFAVGTFGLGFTLGGLVFGRGRKA